MDNVVYTTTAIMTIIMALFTISNWMIAIVAGTFDGETN